MRIGNGAPKGGTPAGYRMVNRGKGAAEIYLYGPIGQDFWGEGLTAKRFADDLKALGAVDTIDLRINSEGGDVMDARAIYTLLVQHKAKVVSHVDGLAASAASFIAMAGSRIEIAAGGFIMIHNGRMLMFGEAEDMRRAADLLETVNSTIRATYVARTRNDESKVKAWMDAETWFTGEEAKAAGFADVVVEDLKVAASLTRPDRFRNLPVALRPRRAAAAVLVEAMRPRA